MADTKYRLELGVQQTLAAVLPQLAEQIPTWQEEIAAGEIGEQLRQVATALGWITSRDSRVKPIGRQTSPSTVRPSPLRSKKDVVTNVGPDQQDTAHDVAREHAKAVAGVEGG